MDDIPVIQSIPAGVVGLITSVSLTQINGALAAIATTVTIGAMGMRLYREVQYQREERRLCKNCKAERLSKKD